MLQTNTLQNTTHPLKCRGQVLLQQVTHLVACWLRAAPVLLLLLSQRHVLQLDLWQLRHDGDVLQQLCDVLDLQVELAGCRHLHP
jgi:hypothetical protein